MALVRADCAWIVYGFAMFAIRGWVARGGDKKGSACEEECESESQTQTRKVCVCLLMQDLVQSCVCVCL
jgi:hypothetical protein